MNHSNARPDVEAGDYRPLVLYHGGCADGQGAAAAFYSKYPNAEFYPATYGRPVPDVTNREVYLLDFSYPRAVIEKMCSVAASVIIIDHHKSAMLDLKGLELPNLAQHFDMNYSGAVLTWMYCWPNRTVPMLLQYVQDRDLWKFELPDTRAISAYLYSTEFDVEEWCTLLNETHFLIQRDTILIQGHALYRQDEKRIKEIVKHSRLINIEGHVVPAVNCNHYFASDAGNVLARGHKFGACYFDSTDGRRFSLRSTKGGFDVSVLAKGMGGGGHAVAAGFSVPFARAAEYEILKWWQLWSHATRLLSKVFRSK